MIMIMTANVYMAQALCPTLFMDYLMESPEQCYLIELCKDVTVQCHWPHIAAEYLT